MWTRAGAGLLLTLTGALASIVPAGWPVDDPVLVSGFRPPDERWAAGHRGIDVRAATGDPVRAMADGQVAFAGSIAGKPVVVVALPGPDRLRLTYEPVTAAVTVGQAVREGEVIGSVAPAGGHCGGMAGCLHVGLRSPDGYRDPLSLVGRRPAVLKPLRR